MASLKCFISIKPQFDSCNINAETLNGPPNFSRLERQVTK